jgi:hypothetical protein
MKVVDQAAFLRVSTSSATAKALDYSLRCWTAPSITRAVAQRLATQKPELFVKRVCEQSGLDK